MIAINWPLLILTNSHEFPRKVTIAGMVKMCGNETMVTNKRFDGNWGNLYTRGMPHSNIFLLSKYHLLYLEVNLMPYGFLLIHHFAQWGDYKPTLRENFCERRRCQACSL